MVDVEATHMGSSSEDSRRSNSSSRRSCSRHQMDIVNRYWITFYGLLILSAHAVLADCEYAKEEWLGVIYLHVSLS